MHIQDCTYLYHSWSFYTQINLTSYTHAIQLGSTLWPPPSSAGVQLQQYAPLYIGGATATHSIKSL